MGFCSKCGAGLPPGAGFCGSCGAPVGTVGSAGAEPAKGAGLEPNVAALLTYVLGFITGIIFLALEPYKNDRFVRFHAFQSIFFSVAWFVFWIIWNNLVWIGLFSSVGLMWMLVSLVSTIIFVAVFLLWLFLMYKAYNRERFMLPFIGELAAKQAG